MLFAWFEKLLGGNFEHKIKIAWNSKNVTQRSNKKMRVANRIFFHIYQIRKTVFGTHGTVRGTRRAIGPIYHQGVKNTFFVL